VFAAGNSMGEVADRSPQNVPESVTVSASTNIDAAASFSNFGDGLDVAAPGAGENVPPPDASPQRNILSLKAANCGSAMCPAELLVGVSYVRQAGTSMAAPHAAGVAALVLAAQPSFTVEQVRQALRRGSDDIGNPCFDTKFGYGRLNADRALSETAPLQALITSPTIAPISGTLRVGTRGVASGPGFASYTLEYGAGTLPTAWTTITTSTSPVSSDGPLADWDISRVRDGVYTLRLTARTTSGQSYEDRQRATIIRW
jgi:subtilisin family serine protease